MTPSPQDGVVSPVFWVSAWLSPESTAGASRASDDASILGASVASAPAMPAAPSAPPTAPSAPAFPDEEPSLPSTSASGRGAHLDWSPTLRQYIPWPHQSLG